METTQILGSLSNPDLEKKKLILEIQLLQKQVEPEKEKVSFLKRINNYLQENLGQLLAILVLIAGFIVPVNAYLSDLKKSQLIVLNSSLLTVFDRLDTSAAIKPSVILDISTQDPEVVAPFMLSRLNAGELKSDIITPVYKKMYEINTDAKDIGCFRRLILWIWGTNADYLRQQLLDNTILQFSRPLSSSERQLLAGIWTAYVDIIFALHLNKDPDFKEAFAILTEKEKTDKQAYEGICSYIKTHK